MNKIEQLKSFISETGEELRKCVWPTRQELVQSTIVVIISVIILAAFVGLSDFVLAKLLRLAIPAG